MNANIPFPSYCLPLVLNLEVLSPYRSQGVFPPLSFLFFFFYNWALIKLQFILVCGKVRSRLIEKSFIFCSWVMPHLTYVKCRPGSGWSLVIDTQLLLVPAALRSTWCRLAQRTNPGKPVCPHFSSWGQFSSVFLLTYSVSFIWEGYSLSNRAFSILTHSCYVSDIHVKTNYVFRHSFNYVLKTKLFFSLIFTFSYLPPHIY